MLSRASLLAPRLVLGVVLGLALASAAVESSAQVVPAEDVAARPFAPMLVDRAAVESGVRAVLDAQVAAWNVGSVRGFMAGYAETAALVFLSGTNVRRGWEEALYGYLRSYPDAATMGLLSFDEVTIEPLSDVHALVWGRWRLRVDGPAEAQPGGLFTLLFVRTDQGWRIVHDHTS